MKSLGEIGGGRAPGAPRLDPPLKVTKIPIGSCKEHDHYQSHFILFPSVDRYTQFLCHVLLESQRKRSLTSKHVDLLLGLFAEERFEECEYDGEE